MKNILFIIALIGYVYCHVNISIDNNGYFRDQQGRIIIYHGMNVVYKPEPFYPKTDKFDPLESFSEEDCQILRDLGMNVIRLHVAFEGAMPEKDKINLDYLNKIKEIVQMAAKYDIYVLLDAHQDLLNRQFCGEGFPDWAIDKQNFPSPQKFDLRLDEKGYPLIEDCLKQDNFANFYLTSDVGRNYESILKNENGVADSFALFWKNVAQLFKDETNILGYDLLNEPVAANWQRSKIDFIWPGWGNKHLIIGFYRIINEQIRKVDNDTLVFFEPYFTDVFGGGFDTNIGGVDYQHKEVLSYHVYCGIVDKEGSPTNLPFCNSLHTIFMKRKYDNKKHLKVGSFMSEFGASANTEGGEKMLNDLLSKADYYHESWTYWQYKKYNDFTTAQSPEESGLFKPDGSYQTFKMKSLVRPYAYAICAKELKQNYFDEKHKQFHLRYLAKQGCETEIYIPNQVQFESGFIAKFQNCDNCQLKNLQRTNYYSIQGKIQDGQEVQLLIEKSI